MIAWEKIKKAQHPFTTQGEEAVRPRMIPPVDNTPVDLRSNNLEDLVKEMRRVLKGAPSFPDRFSPLAILRETRRMCDAFWEHATRISLKSGYVRKCQNQWSNWKAKYNVIIEWDNDD